MYKTAGTGLPANQADFLAPGQAWRAHQADFLPPRRGLPGRPGRLSDGKTERREPNNVAKQLGFTVRSAPALF